MLDQTIRRNWKDYAQPTFTRPVWESSAWWQRQLEQTPSATCVRNVLHGTCVTFTTATKLGRTITHHCPVCGWEKPVLVQEGGLAPCMPVSELPKKVKIKRKYSPEVVARMQKGRAKSIAIHGIKRRKWEDED